MKLTLAAPSGGSRSWRRRHITVIGSALVLMGIIAAVGVTTSSPTEMVGLRELVVGLFLVMAASERTTETMRSLMATSGLFVATTALISASDGALVAHLSVPVAMVLATVYRRPAPWILGAVYTLVYYGVVTPWAPDLVFNDLPLSDQRWWTVALVVSAAAASLAGMAGWLFDVDAQQDNEALALALAEASLRQRQAVQIHDDVIQGLVTAKYALDADEPAMARQSVEATLTAAKDIVGHLLRLEGADLAVVVSRDRAAGAPGLIDGDDISDDLHHEVTDSSPVSGSIDDSSDERFDDSNGGERP